MAALSDPRAFLSAQEKRNDQLKQMGIEEADIQNIPGVQSGGAAGAKNVKNEKKGSKTKKGVEEVKGMFYEVPTMRARLIFELLPFWSIFFFCRRSFGFRTNHLGYVTQ